MSTTAEVGSRHPDRLVWWFFLLGFLKVLLGKPGTLHSPGHSVPSVLGVPPDLREASGFRRLVKDHGRVGMWLHSHRSRGSGVPQLPGRGRSLALSACGTVSQPDCLAILYLLFTSPARIILPLLASRMSARYIPLCHILASRMYESGSEGPAGSFGACTPPHRQLLCGVAGSLFRPLYRSGF